MVNRWESMEPRLGILGFAGVLVVTLALVAGMGCDGGERSGPPQDWVVPPAELPPPPWPEWALEHWVWEDESTQESARALVSGYLERGVPVGAIIIDSPWETGYNTFDFDPDLYPDPEGLIRDLHDLDVRVLLWIVSAINVDAPNFPVARDRGYLVKKASGEDAIFEWWKGDGGFLDYTNPEAVTWWHAEMGPVLDMGIDGWKADGTDFSGYLLDLLGGMYGWTGRIEPAAYSEMYYRDFFAHTRERLGRDRIITARPVDSYGTPIPFPFAPGDVNLAGWVGDQDPTFEGLRNALFNLFASSGLAFRSDKAYVNLGSDIGGYRGDGVRDRELFIRWTQLGALCPVMENGGAGEHRPWMYDPETLDIYAEYTCLHHQLIPYLYSQGAEAYAAGESLMIPEGAWRLQGRQWNYRLGDALFVSAIVQAGGGVEISLPEGRWFSLATGEAYAGGGSHTGEFSLERYPVYVREGELLPLRGEDGCGSRGLGVPEGVLAFLVWPGTTDRFSLYEEGGQGAVVSYRMEADRMSWEITATARPIELWVRGEREWVSVETTPGGTLPSFVDPEAFGRSERGWYREPGARGIRVRPGRCERGFRVVMRFS